MTRNSKDETDPHHEANHLFFISAPPPCVVWNVWNNEAALDRLQWAATGLDHCRLGRDALQKQWILIPSIYFGDFPIESSIYRGFSIAILDFLKGILDSLVY